MDKMYRGLQATDRHLHSELLRLEHLPFLKDLGLANFDPSADQYVTAEMLRDHCPVRFSLSIHSWDVHDLTSQELERMYRRLAGCGPSSISFSLCSLDEEPKIKALLKVARDMRGA
jgi:hypothetical protein